MSCAVRSCDCGAYRAFRGVAWPFPYVSARGIARSAVTASKRVPLIGAHVVCGLTGVGTPRLISSPPDSLETWSYPRCDPDMGVARSLGHGLTCFGLPRVTTPRSRRAHLLPRRVSCRAGMFPHRVRGLRATRRLAVVALGHHPRHLAHALLVRRLRRVRPAQRNVERRCLSHRRLSDLLLERQLARIVVRGR